MSTKAFVFYCDCTDSSYAFVYANQPYKVHLCGAFWSAPATGTDSKAGTLVHETSHFTVVAGTQDYAYGQSACRSLAISNPTRASQQRGQPRVLRRAPLIPAERGRTLSARAPPADRLSRDTRFSSRVHFHPPPHPWRIRAC